MTAKLRKLAEQVVVITGASSGIGLMTAEMAARKGAKVVLAARSKTALDDIVRTLVTAGFEATAVACDVAQQSQVEQLAADAVAKYGRIDTWINNAGLGLYGRLDQTDPADDRRLFDINFWGVVHGCRAALPHLRSRGGALITTGSEVSESYVPLLGMYTATKHAVKGFIDALRVEIEEVDKAPVSITLIQPTAVNTPFPQHARNYLPHEPKLPDPRIDPRQVAEAILAAAETPTRDHRVGTMAKVSTTVASLFPRMGDRMAAGQVENLTTTEPPKNPAGALHQSSESSGLAGCTHGTAS